MNSIVSDDIGYYYPGKVITSVNECPPTTILHATDQTLDAREVDDLDRLEGAVKVLDACGVWVGEPSALLEETPEQDTPELDIDMDSLNLDDN